MRGNAALMIPKDRLVVTLRLVHDVTITGEIFLEYASADLPIHHKISTFLENEDIFFPIRVYVSDDVEFIHKKSVLALEVDIPENPEGGFFPLIHMHSIPINARLTDGTAVAGELMAEVPREKARLSDCLNMSNGFLSVKADQKMSYLNKNWLLKVVHADKAS